MLASAAQFFAAFTDGTAPDVAIPACHWHVNQRHVGDCITPFAADGPLAAIEQVRGRTLLAADEARGLAVFSLYEDFAATDGAGYPRTLQVTVLLRFESGKLAGVHAFTSELPYGMRPHGAR